MSASEVQIVGLAYVHGCISEVIHNPPNPRSSAHCSYDALLPSISLNYSWYIFSCIHTEMKVVIVGIAQSEKEADKMDEGWKTLY